MSFAVRHIAHVEVYVQDIEASARWYDKVLGLKEIHRWDPEPLMIGAGDTKLSLFKAAEGAKRSSFDRANSSMRWHRVAWLTDEEGFARAQEHLTGLGIPFRGPLDHVITKSICFKDPDNHRLEITYFKPT